MGHRLLLLENYFKPKKLANNFEQQKKHQKQQFI